MENLAPLMSVRRFDLHGSGDGLTAPATLFALKAYCLTGILQQYLTDLTA
jgi:hypothetical protein